MAISNFVPEIWSAQIWEALRLNLVYGGSRVVNRDYEGDIAQAGDTVHITSFTDPTIRSYTVETNITVDAITDATRALVIDQADYFAFDVDDVNERQGLPGWAANVAGRSAYLLAKDADAYLASTMYTALNATAYDLGAVTADISDNTAYGNVFVALWTQLTEANVPPDGRWVVVDPDLYAALLQDARFVDASQSGSTDALRNGFVGRVAGFDVYVSNQTPDPTSGVSAVIAGHPMAVTYAEQISSVEAQRRELRFGDLIKGLHLYGAKVVHPEAMALMSVTVQA
jgi:P22 coat protein - gene protein 5